MSQDLEKILRASLDEADRYRKRTVIGSCVLAAVVVGLLFQLDRLRQAGDVATMLIFAVAIVIASQVTVAVITWGIIALVGRKLLKSIELLVRE